MMTLMDDMIGFNTVRTSKSISRLLNLKLKPYDITAEQWTVLKRLNEVDNITQKELSERSEKDQATLTKILDLLEKRELVARKPNPADRRSYLIDITDNGKGLTEELIPLVENIFANLIGDISKEQLGQYIDVLNRLHQNIVNYEDKNNK